jgi:hypothetical protein
VSLTKLSRYGAVCTVLPAAMFRRVAVCSRQTDISSAVHTHMGSSQFLLSRLEVPRSKTRV